MAFESRENPGQDRTGGLPGKPGRAPSCATGPRLAGNSSIVVGGGWQVKRRELCRTGVRERSWGTVAPARHGSGFYSTGDARKNT